MRSATGGGRAVLILAVALWGVLLGFPPPAHATFELALSEDGVAPTVVMSGPSFGPVTTGAVTFGDYIVTFFSAVASNGAGGSNLLSSTTRVESTSTGTHTLALLVSNQDYTLPAGSPLAVQSGMGGTYGAEAGFTGGAVFQMWADAGNGLLTIPGTFSNGLQPATPASGSGMSFDTGVDPKGTFTRSGSFSLTDRTIITTTGLGDANYANHVLVSKTPEPGTTTLLLMGLGAGLVALVSGGWRRS
jgi:hypothetical protein